MCSTDVDFLCKCLNLLYLIKELILCDLILRSSFSLVAAVIPPSPIKQAQFIFYYMFIVYQTSGSCKCMHTFMYCDVAGGSS